MSKQIIGTNVEMEVEGNKLILTIDLTEDYGPSTSGKTNVIATTSGSKNVPTPLGNILVGVNINKKKEVR